jgi:hypothetical protein
VILHRKYGGWCDNDFHVHALGYIESLAVQGVNMVMLYSTGWQGTPVPLDSIDVNRTLSLMDAAWDVGLRVQLCVPGLPGVFRVDDYTAYHSMGEATFAALDQYLAAVSVHPALLGYCEPSMPVVSHAALCIVFSHKPVAARSNCWATVCCCRHR